MNLDKYTQKSQEALMNAQVLSENFNHQVIDPAHLLLALIQQEGLDSGSQHDPLSRLIGAKPRLAER